MSSKAKKGKFTLKATPSKPPPKGEAFLPERSSPPKEKKKSNLKTEAGVLTEKDKTTKKLPFSQADSKVKKETKKKVTAHLVPLHHRHGAPCPSSSITHTHTGGPGAE